MAKVIAKSNFMDEKIFTGETYELSDDEIERLGAHNFKVVDESKVVIELDKPPVEENKVMKKKDIKTK